MPTAVGVRAAALSSCADQNPSLTAWIPWPSGVSGCEERSTQTTKFQQRNPPGCQPTASHWVVAAQGRLLRLPGRRLWLLHPNSRGADRIAATGDLGRFVVASVRARPLDHCANQGFRFMGNGPSRSAQAFIRSTGMVVWSMPSTKGERSGARIRSGPSRLGIPGGGIHKKRLRRRPWRRSSSSAPPARTCISR